MQANLSEVRTRAALGERKDPLLTVRQRDLVPQPLQVPQAVVNHADRMRGRREVRVEDTGGRRRPDHGDRRKRLLEEMAMLSPQEILRNGRVVHTGGDVLASLRLADHHRAGGTIGQCGLVGVCHGR